MDGRGFTARSLGRVMYRLCGAFRSVKEHARDVQMGPPDAALVERLDSVQAAAGLLTARGAAGTPAAQAAPAAVPAAVPQGPSDAADENNGGGGAPLLERRAAGLTSSPLRLRPSFDGALLSNDERDALHASIFGYLVRVLGEVRRVEADNARTNPKCNLSKRVSRAGIGPRT